MLYIIRHGETDWNKEVRIQGQSDIPLNDTGREQAREARERYKDVHFDICYCSPLGRAKETAKILLEGRNVPIVYDERLKEVGFGEYEGMDHVMDRNILPFSLRFTDPLHFEADRGAESFESVYARSGDFLRKVVWKDLENGKDVLLVGHGGINKCLIKQITGTSLEAYLNYSLNNAELLSFDYRPYEPIKAVMFDLDGTLIDTEKYYKIAWHDAIARFGRDLNEEEVLSFRSLGRPFVDEQVDEWVDGKATFDEVRKIRNEIMMDLLSKNGIELKPGAIEILQYLRGKGIKTVLVTSNGKKRALEILDEVGLAPYFDDISTADMVKRGKPDPESYEHACEELGLEPYYCMAVEDSPNGVKSAAGAGIKAVMVPDLAPAGSDVLGLTYAVIDNLNELKKLV